MINIKNALEILENYQGQEVQLSLKPCCIDQYLKFYGWKDSSYESVTSDCNEILYVHPDYTCGLYLCYDGFTQEVFVYRGDRDDEPREWRKNKMKKIYKVVYINSFDNERSMIVYASSPKKAVKKVIGIYSPVADIVSVEEVEV